MSNSDKQVWGETIRAFTEEKIEGKNTLRTWMRWRRGEKNKMGWKEVEKEQKKEAEKIARQKVLG